MCWDALSCPTDETTYLRSEAAAIRVYNVITPWLRMSSVSIWSHWTVDDAPLSETHQTARTAKSPWSYREHTAYVQKLVPGPRKTCGKPYTREPRTTVLKPHKCERGIIALLVVVCGKSSQFCCGVLFSSVIILGFEWSLWNAWSIASPHNTW